MKKFLEFITFILVTVQTEDFILATQNNLFYSQETRLIKEKDPNQVCLTQFCENTSCSQHHNWIALSRDTSKVLNASVIPALQLFGRFLWCIIMVL